MPCRTPRDLDEWAQADGQLRASRAERLQLLVLAALHGRRVLQVPMQRAVAARESGALLARRVRQGDDVVQRLVEQLADWLGTRLAPVDTQLGQGANGQWMD